MIYLFENHNHEASIVFDGTTLTEEQKANAVVAEQLPTPETPEGKVAVLKVRKSTGEVWYDYIDRPESETEKRIVELGAENLMALEAIATLYELITGGEQ